MVSPIKLTSVNLDSISAYRANTISQGFYLFTYIVIIIIIYYYYYYYCYQILNVLIIIEGMLGNDMIAIGGTGFLNNPVNNVPGFLDFGRPGNFFFLL